MTATIHVLDLSAQLPHDQIFYDKQADQQRDDLLSDRMESAHHHHGSTIVIAGVGHVVGNVGGTQTVSTMRFMDATKVIHVGETVEWTTEEAVTSHTITFGPEPDVTQQIPPSANVTLDADGARHAVINSTSDVVHSGFITQSPQDRIGLAQAPLSATRFRVTFTQPGVYHYICVLHDELGMVGQVIVVP
jgi:plastocyanin